MVEIVAGGVLFLGRRAESASREVTSTDASSFAQPSADDVSPDEIPF